MNDKQQQILQVEFKAACEGFYVAFKKYRDYKITISVQESLVQFFQASSVLYDNYNWVKELLSNKESSHLKSILLDCQSFSIDSKTLRKKLKTVKKPSRAMLNKYLYKLIAEGYQLQISKQSYAIENVLAAFLGREGFSHQLLDFPNCKLSPDFSKAYQEQNQKEMCIIAQRIPH